jgi:hypothetical protein
MASYHLHSYLQIPFFNYKIHAAIYSSFWHSTRSQYNTTTQNTIFFIMFLMEPQWHTINNAQDIPLFEIFAATGTCIWMQPNLRAKHPNVPTINEEAGTPCQFLHTLRTWRKGKGKALPWQVLTGPEGSTRLRLPDFKTIGTWRWQGRQSYAPAVFTPRKHSWYSFLLQAESTPGSQCGWKDYVKEKFQWHRESIPRPSGL